MKKRIKVITLAVLILLIQSGFVKEGRDECLHCVECYDRAWDDGYKLGKGTGAVNERLELSAILLMHS